MTTLALTDAQTRLVQLVRDLKPGQEVALTDNN